MLNKKNYLTIFFSFIICSCSLYASELKGISAQEKIKDAQRIITNENSTVPSLVELRNGIRIPIEKFEAWAHQNLNLSNDYGFKLLSTESDKLGMKHFRYEQTYKGFAVAGTMYIVHTKENTIVSMNGTLFNKITISNATLDEQSALKSALNFTKAEKYRWQIPGLEKQLQQQSNNPNATYFPKGELKLAPLNGKLIDGNFRLTYCFDIYAETPLSRNYVFVDANNGEVIYTQKRIHHTDKLANALTAYSGTREITTDSVSATNYRLRETGRGQGIETYNLQTSTNYSNTDFVDTDNYWNNVNIQQDEYATDAHWGAEKTYDFYFTKYGRNSIDNNGFKLISYVHYDINFTNAFWDGTQMTYGDGSGVYTPLTSLDITGHEISHGLTEKTSNLIYSDESGALNEGFSDCMGNAIRYYGKQPTSIDWLIGDEIGGAPFRNMADPNQYQNPDCYNGLYWNAPNEVHNNSGVLNFWFYLLTEGGAGTNDIGNSYIVDGLGIDAAAAICYRMNAFYLVPSSDYAQARTYAIQAAIDLYGACTNEVEQTTNAWYAVGVGTVYNPLVISSFSAPVTSFCSIPADVTFLNASNNAGVFTWDFGDGTTATTINPIHTYNSYGNYTITLIADGGVCGTDTLTKQFYVSVDTINPCVISLPVLGVAATQTACSGQLYDSGGPTADYTDNTDATITIAPLGASNVTLTFTSFNFESNYDYLYVYDGNSITSPLIGQYSGSTLPNGGSITSSNGAITVRQTTDQGVTESGFALTWQCFISTLPPVTNFVASSTTSCTGVINFTDKSIQGPTTWLWSFGDGSTSNQQNPTHTYTNSGTYNVQLIAANINGVDTFELLNYITINLPVAPTGTGGTFCQNTTGTLTANGSGTLNWFNTNIGGTALGTGPTFITPTLNTTSTFYVESQITSASQFVGPVDNNYGTGGFFTNTNYHTIYFDCLAAAKLVTVKVYASSAGNRTITLKQNGITLNSATVNIPAGTSNVSLNFDLPIGINLELGCEGNVNLYRNQTGTIFPYTINGLVTLTGTDAGSSYYYYFYNWEVQEAPCVSARVPVVANVLAAPTANYSFTSVVLDYSFNDLSSGATSWLWNFGDPASGANNTSTIQNPMHTFSGTGVYSVSLVVSNNLGCTSTFTTTVTITNAGINTIDKNDGFSFYPNPVNDNLTIKLNSDFAQKNIAITISDVFGKIVFTKNIKKAGTEVTLNIANLAAATYALTIESDKNKVSKSILKQ